MPRFCAEMQRKRKRSSAFVIDEGRRRYSTGKWLLKLIDAWPTDTSESTYIGGDEDEGNQIFDKALVWEIWDKVSGKMIVVSPGHDTPLHNDAAPLSFRDFFPCPKPIISVKSNRTLVPVPEFTLYQDQAD